MPFDDNIACGKYQLQAALLLFGQCVRAECLYDSSPLQQRVELEIVGGYRELGYELRIGGRE